MRGLAVCLIAAILVAGAFATTPTEEPSRPKTKLEETSIWTKAEWLNSKIETDAVADSTYSKTNIKFKVPIPAFPALKIQGSAQLEFVTSDKPRAIQGEGNFGIGVAFDVKFIDVAFSINRYTIVSNVKIAKGQVGVIDRTLVTYTATKALGALRYAWKKVNLGLTNLHGAIDKVVNKRRHALKKYATALPQRIRNAIAYAQQNSLSATEAWERVLNTVLHGRDKLPTTRKSNRSQAREASRARLRTLHGVLMHMCYTSSIKYYARRLKELFMGETRPALESCSEMLGLGVRDEHDEMIAALKNKVQKGAPFDARTARLIAEPFVRAVTQIATELESRDAAKSRILRAKKKINGWFGKADSFLVGRLKEWGVALRFTESVDVQGSLKLSSGPWAKAGLSVSGGLGRGEAGIIDPQTGKTQSTTSAAGGYVSISGKFKGARLSGILRRYKYPAGEFTRKTYGYTNGKPVVSSHLKFNLQLPTDFGLRHANSVAMVLRSSVLKGVISDAIVHAVALATGEMKYDSDKVEKYMDSKDFADKLYRIFHELRQRAWPFIFMHYSFVKWSTVVAVNLHWTHEDSPGQLDMPKFDLKRSHINIAFGSDLTKGLLHKDSPLTNSVQFMGLSGTDVSLYAGNGWQFKLSQMVPKINELMRKATLPAKPASTPAKGPLTRSQAESLLSAPDRRGVYRLKTGHASTLYLRKTNTGAWTWTPYYRSISSPHKFQPVSDDRVKGKGRYYGRRPSARNRDILKALAQ